MLTKILFFAGVVIALGAAFYFLWYKPNHPANNLQGSPADGTPCTFGGDTGTYKNGACIITTIHTKGK